MNLDEIRVDIDKVDTELKELFLKRMELIHKVYEYKKENNIPVKNEGREAQIIEKRTGDLTRFKDETKEFFKTMIDISCKYQEQNLSDGIKVDFSFLKTDNSDFLNSVKKVAFQGISGSYGSEMAKKLFNKKELINKPTFKDVCLPKDFL